MNNLVLLSRLFVHHVQADRIVEGPDHDVLGSAHALMVRWAACCPNTAVEKDVRNEATVQDYILDGEVAMVVNPLSIHDIVVAMEVVDLHTRHCALLDGHAPTRDDDHLKVPLGDPTLPRSQQEL